MSVWSGGDKARVRAGARKPNLRVRSIRWSPVDWTSRVSSARRLGRARGTHAVLPSHRPPSATSSSSSNETAGIRGEAFPNKIRGPKKSEKRYPNLTRTNGQNREKKGGKKCLSATSSIFFSRHHFSSIVRSTVPYWFIQVFFYTNCSKR